MREIAASGPDWAVRKASRRQRSSSSWNSNASGGGLFQDLLDGRGPRPFQANAAATNS